MRVSEAFCQLGQSPVVTVYGSMLSKIFFLKLADTLVTFLKITAAHKKHNSLFWRFYVKKLLIEQSWYKT